MTFRELLKKTNHKEIFNHLYKEYYYKNIDDEVNEMSLAYRAVISELLAKDASPASDWVMQIRAVDNCFEDVCWHNSSENETYAIDLTPWTQLIDAPLKIEGQLEEAAVAAHILYEITFYGFTEEKVLEERRSLEGQVDESVDMTEVKKILKDLES